MARGPRHSYSSVYDSNLCSGLRSDTSRLVLRRIGVAFLWAGRPGGSGAPRSQKYYGDERARLMLLWRS
eukprot:330254-Lingulodinium_polyedra.AAC.1